MKTLTKWYPDGVSGMWERNEPHVLTSRREVLNVRIIVLNSTDLSNRKLLAQFTYVYTEVPSTNLSFSLHREVSEKQANDTLKICYEYCNRVV